MEQWIKLEKINSILFKFRAKNDHIYYIYILKWYQITHNSYSISFFNKRHDNKLSVSTARASSKKLLADSKLRCSYILVKFSLHIASFPTFILSFI